MGQYRLVVRAYRPLLRAALIGVGAALIAVAGFALYAWARTHTISEFAQTQSDLDQMRDERRALTRELRTARAEITDLQQQIAYTQHSGEIDGAACTEVKASLADLQSESADLREQLAFYRGIVSPDEARAGVRVLDLRMLQQEAPLSWRYDLVLIQSVRHDKRVAGKAQVRIIGSQNGQEKTLDLASLTASGGAVPQFAFKYFQEFTGDLTLPAGFRPIRVSVTLDVDGQDPSVESEFDWSKIETRNAS